VYKDVEPPLADAPSAPHTPPGARQRITALYQEHALGLVRLAKVMLGDQGAAEDIVQDAFLGLYRNWPSLADQDRVIGYLRASVLNGCRSAHRTSTRRDRALFFVRRPQDIASAEESALIGEANREVVAALRALPARQREAIVLRYYLGLSEEETAQAMNVAPGTVKSAASRGRAALARILKEEDQ
jgi:RNA polymerase sigma-70 factor (sigma-E family)